MNLLVNEKPIVLPLSVGGEALSSPVSQRSRDARAIGGLASNVETLAASLPTPTKR
jgi:hypothetical protein